MALLQRLVRGTATRGVGFWLVAFAFVVTMLGTTLPTPLYPLYERRFGATPVLITVIFGIYACGVIIGLLVFGHLSDEIGRRRVLLPGLALSALSAIAFLSAHGLAALFVGRILSGLSAGAFTSAATAALVDLAGTEKRQRATLYAVAANIGGLACGPLLSGLLARFAPLPLRVAFAVDLALLALAACGIAYTPETVDATDRRLRLRLQRLRIPGDIRGIFLRAVVAGVCGFAVSRLFGAVAPSFLGRVLNERSPAVAGLLVCLLFAMSAVGQLAIVRVPRRWALAAGCGTLIIGIGLLASGIAARSLAVLFVSAAISGGGQGLSIGFGLAEINANIEERRAEVTATYFVLLYLGLALPVISVGVIASAVGLPTAGLIFCGVVGTAVCGVLVTLLRQRAHERSSSRS